MSEPTLLCIWYDGLWRGVDAIGRVWTCRLGVWRLEDEDRAA